MGESWGETNAERALSLPCDELEGRPPEQILHRAIDVGAPAPVTFRWLCQLRAAPYSYDLLDNFGRRSPRVLTPGLEELEPGQRFMTIFALDSFRMDRQITLRLQPGRKRFGDLKVTYALEPAGPVGSRLLVRLCLWRPRWRRLFAVGDLVMMRKQLLTLATLAEEDWRAGAD